MSNQDNPTSGGSDGSRPDPYAPPGAGQPNPYGQSPYGQPQYGQAQPGQSAYGQPQYGQSQYGQSPYGQAAPTGPAYNPYPAGGPYYPGVENRTNDKATWSLICGVAGFFCLSILAGIPAIILGFIARAEIKRTGGRQEGNGMAIAGIVLGILTVLIAIATVAFFIYGFNHASHGYDYDTV